MNLKNYLEKNHSVIYPENESMEDLLIMDDDLKDSKMFLTGENHGVKANIELRKKFLRYYKEKTNFKYYLCELPYSMTYFLNIYLETKDENILNDIYEPLKGTDAWNKDEYDYWGYLYKFNKGLPKNDRIILIGSDIEHQPQNAIRFMKYCLDKNHVSGAINDYIEEFINKDDIMDEESEHFYKRIKKKLAQNEDSYRNLLGEYYFKFKHVNNNLMNRLEVYTGNNFNGVRDVKAYENFLNISSRMPKGKYFGQLGLSHIFQKSFPQISWFGSSLNKEGSQFRNKVLSVAYAYQNCRYLYPTTRRNYESSIDTLDSSIEEFGYFIDSDYTLFKLNGEGSPFKKELIWPLEHKSPTGGVTIDYFQYLVVAKDSEAMEGIQ
ncbi:MAG TPA: hypothetical protein VFD17_00240 [Clostridia bacterium]|nr:hypothetical protein [Clostridia bacterium]